MKENSTEFEIQFDNEEIEQEIPEEENKYHTLLELSQSMV